MVLVDSSVWVSYLQQGAEPMLARLLADQQVVMHEMVQGEVSMGSARQRQTALELLPELPTLPVAAHAEVMLLVDEHRLYGRGMGCVDVHLLTAALLLPGTPPLNNWELRSSRRCIDGKSCPFIFKFPTP